MSAVARVGFLLFAVGWGTNHFVPLLLVYRARMGLGPVDLGLLFAVYALGLMPGLLVGGPLSDGARGRRGVVLPAAVLALAGSALLAAGSTRFALLALGRLVVGLGSGGVFSAGTAWVQDLSAAEAPGTGARRTAVALSCGFGGGPLIGGATAQWLAAPALTPYVLQVSALIAALVMAWRVPGGSKSGAGGGARRDVAAGPAPAAAAAAAVSALPARFFRELGPVAPWVFVFPSIAFVVLPAAVRAQVGGLAIAYAGLSAATCLAAGIFVQPLARPRAARRVAVAGLLAGALGVCAGRAATAAGSPAAVLVAAALLGVGYGCCLIAGLRWIEATAPPATRGRATGAFYVLTYLGFWAPMLLAAAARAARSDGLVLWATAALALGTAGLTAARGWRSDGV